MTNKREKNINVPVDQTIVAQSGGSVSPTRQNKRKVTSRQLRAAETSTKQDDGTNASLVATSSSSGTREVTEQTYQSIVDKLCSIDDRLGLLEKEIIESSEQVKLYSHNIIQRLDNVDKHVSETVSGHSSSLSNLLTSRIDKLDATLADKHSGLNALIKKIESCGKGLQNRDKTVEKLEEWANNFITKIFPSLVAQENKEVLVSTTNSIQEIRTGTMKNLGAVGEKITELERRLDQSMSLLIKHNSAREISQVKSAEIVIDQVQSFELAQAEYEKELLQHLQEFWKRVEDTDSGMRRGIVASRTDSDSLRLMRKKLLRSYIELLLNLGCDVELGDESVELMLVPYDGLVHRWDRSDGEDVAKRHERATVFLPGWKLGNHQEKPLLGRMMEGDNR